MNLVRVSAWSWWRLPLLACVFLCFRRVLCDENYAGGGSTSYGGGVRNIKSARQRGRKTVEKHVLRGDREARWRAHVTSSSSENAAPVETEQDVQHQNRGKEKAGEEKRTVARTRTRTAGPSSHAFSDGEEDQEVAPDSSDDVTSSNRLEDDGLDSELLTRQALSAYVKSNDFVRRLHSCEFPKNSTLIETNCVQLWEGAAEESGGGATANNGSSSAFGAADVLPKNDTVSNVSNVTPGVIIPAKLLKHVPQCFSWRSAGDAWMEYGERELSWKYLVSRGASVLELGAGSGSVSVVIQRAMRKRERRRIHDNVRFLNELRRKIIGKGDAVVGSSSLDAARQNPSRRRALWGGFHSVPKLDEPAAPDFTAADYKAAYALLKEMAFPRSSMDLREAFHSRSMEYNDTVDAEILPAWQRLPFFFDRFLDLFQLFEEREDNRSERGHSSEPAILDTIQQIQDYVRLHYYPRAHGAGFWPYGFGLRNTLVEENKERLKQWDGAVQEATEGKSTSAGGKEEMIPPDEAGIAALLQAEDERSAGGTEKAYKVPIMELLSPNIVGKKEVELRKHEERLIRPAQLISRIVALAPQMLFRHVLDFLDFSNHIAVQPLTQNTTRGNYMMSGVSLTALEANRDRCFPNKYRERKERAQQAALGVNKLQHDELVLKKNDAVKNSTRDDRTLDTMILTPAFQIVTHSLERREGEVWIQRTMLSRPFDTVIADCEGCIRLVLVKEFRKNWELFHHVNVIIAERDDVLVMAHKSTGIAAAHNVTGPYNLLFDFLHMKRVAVRDGCNGNCDVEVWERKFPIGVTEYPDGEDETRK